MPLLVHSDHRSPPDASATQRALANVDPLLTAKEAAAFRRHGVSTFWRHVKLGLVPAPIYITDRSPRWRLSDLCPTRTQGEQAR
jgi:predicted DNA-binding transcriptional regulator AlpA